MKAREVNFDGLVGLTHHYAGLSFGNEASTKHRFQVSNPKLAAKQGLLKMKALSDAGFPQAVIPPQERPNVDVLRQLKAHPEYCRIPVVVLTTSREDTDVAAAYALGVNSYIVKPVEFEKFIAVAAPIDLHWCVLNQQAV